jgi:hypothetical protein
VNLVLDEVVGATEKLRSDDNDGGSTVSNLLVLLLSELDEDATGRVLDFDELEDRRAVVRDGNVLQEERVVSLVRAKKNNPRFILEDE